MRWVYNGYQHDISENAVRAEYTAIFDNFKRRIGEKIRFTVLGVKRADTQNDLDAALTSLILAYNNDYGDCTLFMDDGSQSVIRLNNSDTFGGVKVVVPPSFINGVWSGRPEFARQKTYYLVLEAETRLPAVYYGWKSRLVVKGTGGPKWRYSPQIAGDPQYQGLQTSTSFWYIQQGSSIGRLDYTNADPPLFPTIEHQEMRELVYDSAQQIRVTNSGIEAELLPREWKYFMEATTSQGFTSFLIPPVL